MVPTPPASRVRWLILSLIFLATSINYVDRIMFGVLMPKIRESMPIDAETYGRLTAEIGRASCRERVLVQV